MDDKTRREAIALYDRFTHEERRVDCPPGAISDCRGQSDPPLERRDFFAAMTRIAGGAAAANLLIGSIAASPAAAAIVAADDKRLTTRTMQFSGGHGVTAYVAEPRSRSLKATVMVIHENRGQNEHIRDVARRLALAGYRAVAPDFLAPSGGTPADEDAARTAIGKLDLGVSTAAAVSMIEELAKSSRGGKVGVVGFCWGGAFVNRLAVAAGSKLAGGVSYYGTAPAPSEAARVTSPLLIHLAGRDARVNQTAYPWVTALRAAGKTVTFQLYDDVDHAFHNDTSGARYNKAAADLSWKRTLAFFKRTLG